MKLLDGARQTLQYFALKEWVFPKRNYEQVGSEMSAADRAIFPTDLSDFNANEMTLKTSAGWKCLKKYKLKENPEDVEKARKRIKM